MRKPLLFPLLFKIGAIVGLLLVNGTAAHAQSAAEMLPPSPPNVLTRSSTPSSLNAPQPASSELLPTPQRFTVLINGDSPYLLQQVRLVEPGATLQQYQQRQIIQAGSFETETAAQQRVSILNGQGIQAEVTRSPVSAAVSDRYVIIVPGAPAQLAAVRDRAIQLGIRSEAIQQRTQPFGTHLAIGPFPERGAAEEVNRYLRQSGLDSQVFYER